MRGKGINKRDTYVLVDLEGNPIIYNGKQQKFRVKQLALEYQTKISRILRTNIQIKRIKQLGSS